MNFEMNYALDIPKHVPNHPAPADATPLYVAGWEYGDWSMALGGNLRAVAPESWGAEKATGFSDRLAFERAQRAGKRSTKASLA